MLMACHRNLDETLMSNIYVLPLWLGAVMFLVAILTTQVVSDFFYLTAITLVFFNSYEFDDKNIRHMVFVLDFIDG